MIHPLLDFSDLSVQELLEKHQEYTKKLYKIEPGSSLYNSVQSMRESVHIEYQERLYLQTFKDNKEQQEVIEIGEIESTTYAQRNYPDDGKILASELAKLYSKKEERIDDQDS